MIFGEITQVQICFFNRAEENSTLFGYYCCSADPEVCKTTLASMGVLAVLSLPTSSTSRPSDPRKTRLSVTADGHHSAEAHCSFTAAGPNASTEHTCSRNSKLSMTSDAACVSNHARPLFKGSRATQGAQTALPKCHLELLRYTHELGTYFFLTQHTVSPIATTTPAPATTASITPRSANRQGTRH